MFADVREWHSLWETSMLSDSHGFSAFRSSSMRCPTDAAVTAPGARGAHALAPAGCAISKAMQYCDHLMQDGIISSGVFAKCAAREPAAAKQTTVGALPIELIPEVEIPWARCG